jgi:hypothetical protein
MCGVEIIARNTDAKNLAQFLPPFSLLNWLQLCKVQVLVKESASKFGVSPLFFIFLVYHAIFPAPSYPQDTAAFFSFLAAALSLLSFLCGYSSVCTIVRAWEKQPLAAAAEAANCTIVFWLCIDFPN